jgi:hypothetical protein
MAWTRKQLDEAVVAFATPLGMILDQRNVARRWARYLDESGLRHIVEARRRGRYGRMLQ